MKSVRPLPVLDKYILSLCEEKHLDFTAAANELKTKAGLVELALPPRQLAERYWELVGGEKRPFLPKGLPTTTGDGMEEESGDEFIVIPEHFKIIPDLRDAIKSGDPYDRSRVVRGGKENDANESSEEDSPCKSAAPGLAWTPL